MICYWFSAPSYFFFASDLPPLLYYSHLPAAILALLVGLVVLLNAKHSLLNRLLFVICLCFALWVTINLIAWTNINSPILLFGWSFYGVLQVLISIFSVYFISVFLEGKDVSAKIKMVFVALFLPAVLFAHTDLHLKGFNLAWCDAFQFEGLLYKSYYTLVGVVAMFWILYLIIRKLRTLDKKQDQAKRQQIKLMAIGIEFFLFSFFTIVFLATYLAGLGLLDDSRLEFYGLFGMTVFMVLIGVLIVRFKAFNVSTHVANVLIIGLLLLVASQYTYANSTTTTIVLTTITLVFTVLISMFLARSVRKEITQRQELEQLTVQLEKANVKLKKLDKLKSEFVSIASHQLRSPLTSIRGYASMLSEGSFGKLPKEAIEPVNRIAESSQQMAVAVEDYLNVSRIESGNMKYNLSEFNLKDEVEKITDDIRPIAVKKGLVMLFRNKLNSKGVVKADQGKAIQIVNNLINNSLKYTPRGSITVIMRDDVHGKKIFVDITDTGIGMNQETIDKVFGKFERADNANSVNVSGTGLGLFVALKMAKAMNGDITAHSEGDGKGSTFTFELPLVQ